jgi:hypothetical protein
MTGVVCASVTRMRIFQSRWRGEQYYQITQAVFKYPIFMSVPDTAQLRNESQYSRDEKGKFTSTLADAETPIPAAHGNQDMTNILRHIGIFVG